MAAKAEARRSEALDFLAVWRAAGRRRWFRTDPAFDAELRARFLELHLWAAAADWSAAADDAAGALALVLLLDQAPRNIFRGTAHAFATDPLARRAAGAALALGRDAEVELELAPFFYLPFVHAEDRAAQALGLRLMRRHLRVGGGADWLRSARRHAEAIRRFGRFPHRNAALGRDTTPAEAAWMRDGGLSA